MDQKRNSSNSWWSSSRPLGRLGRTGQPSWRLIYCGVLVCAVVAQPLSATAGENRVNFLTHGAGARAIGMGSAYGSICEDVFGMFYNPAGLARLGGEVALEHAPVAGGGRINFLGGILPVRSFTTGLGVFQYTQDGIRARVGIDDDPTIVGGSQTALLLPVATGFGEWEGDPWRVGMTFKMIRENLAGFSDEGFGADAGVMKVFRVGPVGRIRTGYVIRNLMSPRLRLREDAESFDLEHRLSLAWAFRARGFRDPVTLALEKGMKGGSENLCGGLEYAFSGIAFLRAGYGEGWRMGLGARMPDETWGLDYAFEFREEDFVTHRFTVTRRWGFGKLKVSR